MSTLTTVGYGDKVPVMTEGRLLAMAMVIAGVGMLGGLTGLVAALFLGQTEHTPSETRKILSRLDALHVKPDTLSRDLSPPRSSPSRFPRSQSRIYCAKTR